MSVQTVPTAEAKQALWRLVVNDLIDREANNEVTTARELIQALFAGKHKMERKQITNLEGIVGETRSMAIVIDFVRYQMGRDDKKPHNWRAPIKQDTFGNQVVKHIEELKNTAQRIINSAKGKGLTPDNETDELIFVWWLLVRRFASYLEHAFVYEETMQKERSQAPR